MMLMTATYATKPPTRSDLVFRHLGERLAVAADGEQKDDEILHATAEDGAGENPERAGR